jgi:uncharacterized membrane protein YozB (DUF420 family)
MSAFTNPFILIPTISLVAQAIVFGLVIYGYWLKRQLNFQHHGKIMSLALIVHLIFIFTIMVPSFVLAIIPEYFLRNIFGAISIISLIHVPLGILAFTFGLWLVVAWRLKGVKSCVDRKKFMLPTIIAWFVSLSLGLLLYGILIMSILKG